MKKNFLAKTIIIFSVVISVFAITTVSCFAFAEYVNLWNGFPLNILQVDWSNADGYQVQHDFLSGDKLRASRNEERRTSTVYNYQPFRALYTNNGADRTSSFVFSTNSDRLDTVVGFINPAYAHSTFEFNIDLRVGYFYGYDYSDMTYMYPAYVERFSLYSQYIVAKLYLDGGQQLFAENIISDVYYIKGNFVQMRLTYTFRVPEQGATIVGFFFNFPHSMKLEENYGELYCTTRYNMTDFLVDNASFFNDIVNIQPSIPNPPLPPDVDFTTEEDVFGFVNSTYQDVEIDYNLVSKIFNNSKLAYTMRSFSMMLTTLYNNVGFIHLLVDFSVAVGCFAFVFGLIQSLGSFIKNRTQNNIKNKTNFDKTSKKSKKGLKKIGF